MAKSTKVLNDEVRAQYMALVREAMAKAGDEVLEVASNELALPVVDSEGNEKWVVLTVKVPSGSRDGDAYDGYAMAEDWQMRQAAKVAKQAAKAARDNIKRAKA